MEEKPPPYHRFMEDSKILISSMIEDAKRLNRPMKEVERAFDIGVKTEKLLQEKEHGNLTALITKDIDKYFDLMHQRVARGYRYASDYILFNDHHYLEKNYIEKPYSSKEPK